MRLDPPIPANAYHDSFGNFCHVIRTPAGRLAISADFLVRDKGEPDEIAPQAEQHALEDLPSAAPVRDALLCLCTWAGTLRSGCGPCRRNYLPAQQVGVA
jgi:hypothetical protein